MLTDKFVAVLGALLWGFHNAGNGRCFPIVRDGSPSKPTAAARRSITRSTHWSRRHPHLGEPDRAHPGVGA